MVCVSQARAGLSARVVGVEVEMSGRMNDDSSPSWKLARKRKDGVAVLWRGSPRLIGG